MDTQSYGLFHFYFLCSETRSRSDEWLLLSFPFRLFKRQISFKGDLYYHQCTRGGDTETRGIFPSRDTQRYHFGRVASKREETRREEQKTKATARWRGCLFYMTFID